MFAQAELECDLLVSHSFRDKAYNISFARGTVGLVTFDVSIEANYNALRFGQRSELNRQPVSTELRNRARYRLSADAVFTWESAQHGRLLG